MDRGNIGMNHLPAVRLSLLAAVTVPFVGSAALAEDTPFVKQAFEGYTAEEVHGWVADLQLADALAIGRPLLWFSTNGAQVFPTAVIPARNPASTFETAPIAEVPGFTAETAVGTMPLAEFIEHPDSYTRGFIVVHEGKIVYETYPGMRPNDFHITASASKVFASLLVDVLIDEGLIDENVPIGTYVEGFKGSAWEQIRVVDVLDMASGLDAIDGPEYFADPTSIIARMLTAEMGNSDETMLGVMREAQPVAEPGAGFTYSSMATQALVFLVEGATGKPWAQVFDERIWSRVRADGPMQVHLSPDGIALVHGFMSVALRDLARFGMLYTDDWDQVATERVVTPPILERTRSPQRTRDFYRAGPSGEKFMERLGDDTVRTGGRQWDAIWDDGDFFKSGLNTQGIYVSPDRSLVIAYFSNDPNQTIQKYLRPLATSGLFGN